LLADIEADSKLTIVVFKSDDPDFFMAHYDIASDIAAMAAMPPGSERLHPWNDVLVRLSRVPVLTVASIRGGRGAGSEFLLACDVRFASREKAILGQWEVGAGRRSWRRSDGPAISPRGTRRALEILIGSDDFAGDLAERYGYVNRAVPDAELDTFVETFARRIAGFEKEAIPIEKLRSQSPCRLAVCQTGIGVGRLIGYRQPRTLPSAAVRAGCCENSVSA